MKKLVTVLCSLTLASTSFAQAPSSPVLSRYDQVVAMIQSEEASIARLKSQIQDLTLAVASAEADRAGARWTIALSGAGGFLGTVGVAAGIDLGRYGGSKAFTFMVGAVVIACVAVVVNGVRKLILTGPEMEKLKAALDMERQSLGIRERGLVVLKERLGVNLNTHEITTQGR